MGVVGDTSAPILRVSAFGSEGCLLSSSKGLTLDPSDVPVRSQPQPRALSEFQCSKSLSPSHELVRGMKAVVERIKEGCVMINQSQ